jgi:signal transduction histidine kinase
MQSGKLNLNPTLVDLYALIEQIILDFKHQSQQYGITLRNEVSQGLPNVNVDQGKLQRVMINLVENALKFTPSGGEVVVKTEMANSGIIVHVEDSGPGIPDEYREKIFERFVQVPDQLGRQRGIGLGLTFCRLTIEAHGGKIWVDSRPGGGSVFSFFLPLD